MADDPQYMKDYRKRMFGDENYPTGEQAAPAPEQKQSPKPQTKSVDPSIGGAVKALKDRKKLLETYADGGLVGGSNRHFGKKC